MALWVKLTRGAALTGVKDWYIEKNTTSLAKD
jgi:hypothetical protein